MRLKMLFGMLLALGACTIFSASSFANEVEVLWDKQAVNGIYYDYDASIIPLVDNEVLIGVGSMMDKKVSALEAQGQLPFKTVIISDYKNNDWQSKMQDQETIALVPVVTSDFNTSKKITYQGIDYYSYEVRAELNVLLCTFDGRNLKIIHNLPLSNQAVLGGSLEDALTEPLTQADLKEQYLYNLEQLIDELSFSPEVANKLSGKEMLITYQVKDVDVNPAIRANYEKNSLSDYRLEKAACPVIASTYTSKYAEKFKDRCVLPSKLTGNRWREEVVKHITGGDIAAGEYDAALEPAADMGITVKLNDFTKIEDNSNPYSVLRFLKFSSTLEAFDDERKLGSVISNSTYKLPTTIPFELGVNYLEIFNDAAFELGMQLDKLKVKK